MPALGPPMYMHRSPLMARLCRARASYAIELVIVPVVLTIIIIW